LTHNLAIGVFTGIILSTMFFVSKISRIRVDCSLEGEKRIYYVKGELFFASVTELLTKFDYKEDVKSVDINLSGSHIWDDSAVAAIDRIDSKFEENDIIVNVRGLNEDSTELVKKLANKLGTH
jgi:sulfate permease, SulP family